MDVLGISIKEWVAIYGALGLLSLSGWVVAYIGISNLWQAWRKSEEAHDAMVKNLTTALNKNTDTLDKSERNHGELMALVRGLAMNTSHTGR